MVFYEEDAKRNMVKVLLRSATQYSKRECRLEELQACLSPICCFKTRKKCNATLWLYSSLCIFECLEMLEYQSYPLLPGRIAILTFFLRLQMSKSRLGTLKSILLGLSLISVSNGA